MRLIDADELKKAINNIIDEEIEIDEKWAKGLKYSLKIIDNASTVPLPDFKEGYKQAILDGKLYYSRPSGWILVNERSPEVYKKVLVSDVFGVYIGEFIDAEENWGGKHFINECGMQSKSVIA